MEGTSSETMIDFDVVLGTCVDESTSDKEAIVVFAEDKCNVTVDSWKSGVIVGYSDDIDRNVYGAWLNGMSCDVVRVWDCLEYSASVGQVTDDCLELIGSGCVEFGDSPWEVVIVLTFVSEVVTVARHRPVTGTFDDFA